MTVIYMFMFFTLILAVNRHLFLMKSEKEKIKVYDEILKDLGTSPNPFQSVRDQITLSQREMKKITRSSISSILFILVTWGIVCIVKLFYQSSV